MRFLHGQTDMEIDAYEIREKYKTQLDAVEQGSSWQENGMENLSPSLEGSRTGEHQKIFQVSFH